MARRIPSWRKISSVFQIAPFCESACCTYLLNSRRLTERLQPTRTAAFMPSTLRYHGVAVRAAEPRDVGRRRLARFRSPRSRRQTSMSFLITFVVILLAGPAWAETRHPVAIECTGLDPWTIVGTLDVDWIYGTIQSSAEEIVIGFATGDMVEEAVPKRRPAGFRNLEVEKVGSVTIRHGFQVVKREYRATLIGASLGPRLNLIARPEHAEQLLALARRLATAKCKMKARPV